MPMPQMAFENIAPKEEIVQNKQFLLIATIKLSVIEILPIYVKMIAKSSAANALLCPGLVRLVRY